MTRHVLFSVAGEAPAVVTETLFGLWQRAIFGGTIHILTTSVGRSLLWDALVGSNGAVAKFNKKYQTVWEIEPRFNQEKSCGIEMIMDESGKHPLEDLRHLSQNEQAADRITEIVRYWTAQDDVILHASLAGGRRTMGVFLAQAMSWFARPEDNLYHVVVAKRLEEKAGWYYPEHEGEYDLVYFSEQPFVRMRGLLGNFLEKHIERLSYSKTAELSQIVLEDIAGKTTLAIVFGAEQKFIVKGSNASFEFEVSSGVAIWLYLFLCRLSKSDNNVFNLNTLSMDDIQSIKAVRHDLENLHFELISPAKDDNAKNAGMGISSLGMDDPENPNNTTVFWENEQKNLSYKIQKLGEGFTAVKEYINDKTWAGFSFGMKSSAKKSQDMRGRYLDFPLEKMKVFFASKANSFLRAEAAKFASENTLLQYKQIGLEIDTGKFKIGDGNNSWNQLAYIADDHQFDCIKELLYEEVTEAILTSD